MEQGPLRFPEQRLVELARRREAVWGELAVLVAVAFAFDLLARELHGVPHGWLLAAALLGAASAAAVRTGGRYLELVTAACPRCGHDFFRWSRRAPLGLLLLRRSCACCGARAEARGTLTA